MKELATSAKRLGILALSAALIPLSVQAFNFNIEESFGGRQLYVLGEEFCNCPDGPSNIHYIMDYKTNQELKLYYKEGASKLYDYQDIDAPDTHQLGTYQQGGPDCQVDTGDGCVTWDTVDGTYGSAPGTGTSRGSGLSI